jgi:hypothetical protein
MEIGQGRIRKAGPLACGLNSRSHSENDPFFRRKPTHGVNQSRHRGRWRLATGLFVPFLSGAGRSARFQDSAIGRDFHFLIRRRR